MASLRSNGGRLPGFLQASECVTGPARRAAEEGRGVIKHPTQTRRETMGHDVVERLVAPKKRGDELVETAESAALQGMVGDRKPLDEMDLTAGLPRPAILILTVSRR